MKIIFSNRSLLLLLFMLCAYLNAQSQIGLPSVTTSPAVVDLNSKTVSFKGNVTADGGSPITEKGVVWSRTENPTTTNKVNMAMTTGPGIVIGPFGYGNITLPEGPVVHYRAYAINAMGISYGANLTFNAPAPATIVVDPATISNPTVGQAYSQTFTASGSTGVYKFVISVGEIPTGLSLNPNTGVLSGTPTEARVFYFTVKATDDPVTDAYSGSRAYTLNVAPPTILIAPSTIPNATVAATYSQTLTASGGIGSYTYSVTAGILPAGLTLNSVGAITGTPTAGGSFNFTVTATGISPKLGVTHSGSRVYTLIVNVPDLTLNPVTLPNVTRFFEYFQQLTAGGGTAPYTYSLSGLPAGLTLSSDGIIKGMPTTFGNFIFTITVHDSSTGTGPYSFPMLYSLSVSNQIVPPTVTTGVATEISLNSARISGDVVTFGGASITEMGVIWSLTDNPTIANNKMIFNGLEVGPFNVIMSSLPANKLIYYRAYAINSKGTSYGQTKTFTTLAPTITVNPATISSGKVGQAYSQTFTASGSTGVYKFAISGGEIPTGLSLDPSTGVLSGTLTASGIFNFTVQAKDASATPGSNSGTMDYTLIIDPPTISFTPLGLPNATVAAAYSQRITASGGVAPYTYALTEGVLPVGLSFSSGGILSGTPTSSGNFSFSVTARDASTGSGPYTVTKGFSISVTAVLPVVNTFMPSSISQTSAILGGHVISDGGVPVTERGIVWSTTANPTTADNKVMMGSGTGTFNAEASSLPVNTLIYYRAYGINAIGTSYGSGATFTTLAPTITVNPATIPGATVGKAYSQIFTASGGTAPYTYTTVPGTLPPGLTLSSDGVISGKPTTNGIFNFTVTGTDSSTGTGPYSGSRLYTLNVLIVPPTVTTGRVASITSNKANVWGEVVATGGSSITEMGFVWSLTDMPTMSDNIGAQNPGGWVGTFYGTVRDLPANTLIYYRAYAITASGMIGYGVTKTFNTLAPPIVISPETLPDLSYGVSYNQTLTSSGGTAPYSYTIISDSFPDGITMSPTGVISGIPYLAADFPVTVKSTDAGGLWTSKVYNLSVSGAVIDITPLTLPDPVFGVDYDQSIVISGGISPYNYSILPGSVLPLGLSLSSAGVLSGTPTSAGTFTFTIRIDDSGSVSARKIYTLNIAPPNLVITTGALPEVTVGTAYHQTLSTTGGIAPYKYSVNSGALPTGMSLSEAGVLSGTPTVKGTYNFVIRSTDSSIGTGPYYVDKNFSIVVLGKVQAITMASTATVNYGDADFDPGASSDSGLPITYSTSNSAVATIVAGKVHIVGAGQVNILADQLGNGSFAPAVLKQQTLTINKAQLQYVANTATKEYGAVNPVLSGTLTGFKYADNLSGSTTGTASFTTTATTTSGVGSYAITGSGLTAANYIFVQAAANDASLSITPKELTITADDKEKFAGTPNPVFTANYSGFIPGENETVVTTKPVFATDATAASAVGDYDINVSGAAAVNYTFKYVKGVLTIKPGAPTDIGLTVFALFENQPSGTNAGTLHSISADPAATFTYTLVPGGGSTDNGLFSISTNKLNTAASLDFEEKASYSVRVRSTSQYGLYFEKILIVTIADVNEIPTLDAISNQSIYSTSNLQTVALSGISAGQESGQTLDVTVSSNHPEWFESLTVSRNGTTGSVNYRVKSGAVGTSIITVTVKDDGGIANGGADTYSQTFVLTVNPLPEIKATNILTPNNDGYNDKWIIDNIDVYPDNEVKVFDRAGRIVYTKKGYDNSWDGTMNGTALSEGTYYYVIDFGAGKRILRGYITLIREN